jgi:hypothetical protein
MGHPSHKGHPEPHHDREPPPGASNLPSLGTVDDCRLEISLGQSRTVRVQSLSASWASGAAHLVSFGLGASPRRSEPHKGHPEPQALGHIPPSLGILSLVVILQLLSPLPSCRCTGLLRLFFWSLS